jgi:hypothetical protein
MGSPQLTVVPLSVTSIAPSASPTGGELQVQYPAPSLSTVYFTITRAPSKAWNGTAFESLASANWTTYAIAGADAGAVEVYTANFPPAIPAGYVTIYAYLQAGGSKAPSDTPIGVEADAFWDGTFLTPGGGGGSGGVTLSQLNAALASLLANFIPLPLARGGSATTITLAAGSGSDVVGQDVQIETGTGVNQVREITACDPTTLVATVTPAWTVTPDTTSAYRLLPASATGGSGSGSGSATFDSGTVSASPVAPAVSGFWATMPGSTAQSGDYTGMSVLFQAAGKPARSRKVSAHSVVGGVHYFALTWSGYPLLPSAPADGDTFEVVP